MVRFGRLLLASTMLALFVSPAWSQDRPRQRPGGGAQRPGQRMDMMPGLGLLTEKSVQEELKMSAEQIEKAGAARKKESEALNALRSMEDREEANAKRRALDKESEKVAMEILKPEQAKRLSQILLQQKRSRGLTDERVVKELKLSDDQLKKIKDIQDEIGRQRREIAGGSRIPPGGGGGREAAAEMRQKMTELDKKAEEKSMEVLSADQKTKWKELLGEPFKGEISFRPQGRRGEARPNRDPR